jgi:type II secretory pathway predicted ATPase ExeA
MGCEAKFYRGDAKRQLHREIELMRGIHQIKPCVIVDEAHLLDREMLEEVRFLLNVKMDSESPMALILVGQSELWDRLRMQTYTAIRQRMTCNANFSIMIGLRPGSLSQGIWPTQGANTTSSPMER